MRCLHVSTLGKAANSRERSWWMTRLQWTSPCSAIMAHTSCRMTIFSSISQWGKRFSLRRDSNWTFQLKIRMNALTSWSKTLACRNVQIRRLEAFWRKQFLVANANVVLSVSNLLQTPASCCSMSPLPDSTHSWPKIYAKPSKVLPTTRARPSFALYTSLAQKHSTILTDYCWWPMAT